MKESNHGAHSEAENRTINKRKETGRKKTEQRGYERVMPLDIRRYKYEHSNHGVHSEAENMTTN